MYIYIYIYIYIFIYIYKRVNNLIFYNHYVFISKVKSLALSTCMGKNNQEFCFQRVDKVIDDI